MNLHDAIELAEQGKRLTNPALSLGSVMKTVEDGDLNIIFEQTGASYRFTPRPEHHNDNWRLVEGWASYG